MKKIMIYAYTYFNLGDDLFIKILCERYQHTQFILYAPSEYKSSLKHLNNITFVNSQSIKYRGINFLFKLLKSSHVSQHLLAKSCDGVVEIGGSLFIQNNDWQYEFKKKKRSKLKDKPFFLLGANFGPYDDPAFLTTHKDMFKQYTDICFRDQYSYDLFSKLDNVRLADDIVFTLDKEYQQTIEDMITISIIKPSIRASLSKYDAIYFNKISELIIHFIDNDYQVTLMSFCEYELDHEAIKTITNLIPVEYHDKIHDFYYKTNLDEALRLIAKSRFLIATRFHAMILGWLYDIPVFPIAYSSKMTQVMEDNYFTGAYTTIEDIHTVDPHYVLESFDTYKHDVSKQVKNAQKQFLKLDVFLADHFNEG